MHHQNQHHQQTQHHNTTQHHRIYERPGILQPTPILHAMKAKNTTLNTTNTTKTNTKPNSGTGLINTNPNGGVPKTAPSANPAPVPLPAPIPTALQRSYTTLDEGDAPQHALRTSLTRRPESLYETKRKSDPTQDLNKSFINIFDPLSNLFNRLGSGRFGQGNSPGGKRGHGGAHGGQAGGHGGGTPSPAPGKKVPTAEKKFDLGRYEKQAASTFYQLTEAKGEPVGEVGVVEGKGAAPPANSHTPKRRVSDPAGKVGQGLLARAGHRMSTKKNSKARNKTPEKDRPVAKPTEAQKGFEPATDPQKPSSKTTDPQKHATLPQKGGTDTGNPSSGVSQGAKRYPDSLPNQNKTADFRGASDPHRGDPRTTEGKRGRRKDPGGTLEAQAQGKDSGMTRGSKKKTRGRFFKSGAKCVGSEEGETTEEEVDGGGGGGGVGGADKHWGRHGSFRGGYGGAGGGGLSSGDPSHSDTELGKLSAPHSLLDGECGSMGRGSVGGGSEASERGMDQGRVTAWATSFEKLLEDPAGLHTFAEFLKKEYSHENIYFYTACERYKRLTCQEEMQSTAKKIFERHLCSGAPEPVNVDSQARQDAQDGLHLPSETLFGQAQKQIFNLMKFDSYSRFLKSGLYTDCLNKERRGQPLLYPGDHTLDPDLRLCPDDAHTKLKKSCSDADERRRRSILPPWSRKDRSKSKDRGEAEYRRRRKHQQHQPQHQQHQRLTSDSSSLRSISGSQTSLNSSSDLPMGRRVASRESLTSGGEPGGGGGGSLSGGEGGVGGRSRSSSSTTTCRVFLPDSSKSVVLLRPQETVQEVMARLLERRGLPYTCFEVYMDNNNKVVCRDEDALALKDKKVRLEPRSVFQLVLPCQRPLFVKADPAKAIGDRLKPLLTKAGLKMDLLHVHKEGEEKALNLKGPIGDLDGLKVIVQTKEDVRDWGVEGGRQKRRTTAAGTLNTTSTTTTGSTTSLDDITNRVFQDLRNGKMECFDDFSVIDLDARSTRTDSSDKSSGIQDFCRRNSFGIEKDSSTHRRYKHRTPDIKGLQHHHHHHHHHQDHYHHHHHNAKRRGGGGGGGLNSTAVNGGGGGGGGVVTTDNDNELYEGLKRAQRSRLDDQRGTEINFELPEFLKNDKKQDASNTDH